MEEHDKLHDMPEWKKLTPLEQDLIIRRLARVSATSRHPERGRKLAEIIDKIREELKRGPRIH